LPFGDWIVIAVVAALASWFLFLRWFNRRNRVEVYTKGDESRQLAKVKSYFHREVVESKVKYLFPDHDPSEILQLLDDGITSFFERERVQLDVLKLSNGDLAKLKYYVGLAESDSLKVTQLAEYPESSKRDLKSKDLLWGDHKKEIERDLRQYLNWLKKKR
jgi:hypothetical protein